MLEPYLDDLEERIDAEIEGALWQEWKDFTDGRFAGELFMPSRPRASAPRVAWPNVSINSTLDNRERMVLQQLKIVSDTLAAEPCGSFLCVRSNYGTGIMPSLFGARLYLMPEETDTLPTTYPLEGGMAAVRDLVRRGVPDLRAGLGARVLETADYLKTLFRGYPRIKKYVHHYHPDLQGPMDVCEMLWGSSLFIDIMDEPSLVKDLLELVTQTYIDFLKAWARIVPFEGEYTVHWAMMHKGHVMLRNDSAMNFSPAIYEEFIKPYNQRIFREFGGGGDHFCGRGDHFISHCTRIEGLHAITMSQPHLNDMETIYRHTVDKGIKLIGLSREYGKKAIAAGRDLHGNVHCG